MAAYNEARENRKPTLITPAQFINIIRGNDPNFLDEYGTVVLKNHEVEDDLLFDDSISIAQRLEIKGCFFGKQIDFWDCTFTAAINFEDCFFENAISLHGNTSLQEDISFNQCHSVNRVNFYNGSFRKVRILFYELDKFWLSAGQFEELEVRYIGGGGIKEMTIIPKTFLGELKVQGFKFEKLFLHYGNFGKSFLFENIKCRSLSIDKFEADSNLKFFGVEPFDEEKKKSTFSIINSNLGSAEFYRVNFSEFDEVNIRDSYVADCVFINCTWKEMISANYSPGYRKELNPERPTIAQKRERLLQRKESIRQLRYATNKYGDKEQSAKFYVQEMGAYNKLIPFTHPLSERFWDKVILYGSDWFSKFGQSFSRPFLFIFIFNLFFFGVLVSNFHLAGLAITSPTHNDWNAFRVGVGEYFKLINPLHKLDESLKGWAIFWDLLSRVSSSFFVYAMIRASRRFVQ